MTLPADTPNNLENPPPKHSEQPRSASQMQRIFRTRSAGPKFAKEPKPARSKRYIVRQSGRIIRYVEPWSVFKVSLIFYISLWLVFLVVGIVLWILAEATVIDRLETFIIELFALETFELAFSRVFFTYALVSFIGALLATAATVLMCMVFNQISGLFGGVRVLVLEENTLNPEKPETNQSG